MLREEIADRLNPGNRNADPVTLLLLLATSFFSGSRLIWLVNKAGWSTTTAQVRPSQARARTLAITLTKLGSSGGDLVDPHNRAIASERRGGGAPGCSGMVLVCRNEGDAMSSHHIVTTRHITFMRSYKLVKTYNILSARTPTYPGPP